MDDRYQYQNRLVKIYRWLRWKPYYKVRAIYALILWVIGGSEIPVEDKPFFANRKQYISFTFEISDGLADYKMKHLYAFEEVFTTKDCNNT